MKIGVMQPYFLPYIGYFQMIEAVDKYILYSDVNFSKKGWSNRNKILLKDGAIKTITVPLAGQSSDLKINKIKIFNQTNWEQKMLSSIYTNYKGSRFFNEIYPFLETQFKNKFEYLYQLNGYLIENICSFIGIKTEIEYEHKNKYIALEEKLLDIDSGNFSQFQYKKELKPDKKVARIIEICKSENATIYVNAIGGQELYFKKVFAEFGVDLMFIEMQEFKYQQFTHEFQPNLSIVDVLMHNGANGTKNLMQKYTLI